MPPQYAATQSMHKLSVQKQCKKDNLEKMYEMVKNHLRQNPQFLLKWQEYFAPEVEAVIEKKCKKHFESASTPYVVGGWKTQSSAVDAEILLRNTHPFGSRTQSSDNNKS